jgi:hypothetical protein
MAERIVAIHQPNFFPWLGFFNKIHRASIFVYLDHVVNDPQKGTWTKRTRLIVNKKPYWLTMPLSRPSDGCAVRIDKMQINPRQAPLVAKKHIRTIQQAYGKAKHFGEIFPMVREFYDNSDSSIANRNICFIEMVCDKLHIATPRVRSSSHSWTSDATDLLVEITRHFDGTAYMCGGGAGGYQEDEKFAEAGLRLIYQYFVHPVYMQFQSKSFVPGLSIIDCLMNCGFERTEELVTA